MCDFYGVGKTATKSVKSEIDLLRFTTENNSVYEGMLYGLLWLC